MSIEAMKMALEAMESFSTGTNKMFEGEFREEIEALRQAIQQAKKQEPVAWQWKERINGDFDSWVISASEPPPYATEKHPLYTAPPKREWVGLTDDDVHDAFNYVEMVKLLDFDRDRPEWCEAFANACEIRLKHKNGVNK